MNSITLQSVASSSTLIDVKGSENPIAVLKLKSALKKAAEHKVFGVMTTDTFAESSLRDFCTGTGNEFLGTKAFDGYAIHYIKKHTVECQRCSKMRVAFMGLVALGTLAYTAPQVLNSSPSNFTTILFLAALVSLPPVSINALRVFKDIVHRLRTPTHGGAAK